MMIIVASLAEVLCTLLGIVPEIKSLLMVRILIRITRARVKSQPCKSGKERLTPLLLLNFRRAHQL